MTEKELNLEEEILNATKTILINGIKSLDDVYKHYLNVIDENQQLKELLKEYKNQLSDIKNAYIDLTTQDEYGSYYIDEANLFIEIVGKTIKDYDESKIDNAIGEK